MKIIKHIVIFISIACFSVSLHATYGIELADTKEVQDVVKFVHSWTDSVDKMSSIVNLVNKLPKKSFRLHFLGYDGKRVDIYNKREFLKWYKVSKRNIISNTHKLDEIVVKKVGNGIWKVSNISTWTVNLKGQDTERFFVEQVWDIEEDRRRGLQLVSFNEKYN